MADNMTFMLRKPENEPVFSYKPGSQERKMLKDKIEELGDKEIEIPLIIGGKEVKTGDTETIKKPHSHKDTLGCYHKAGEKEVSQAIEAAKAAKSKWEKTPWETRHAIFLKAASMLAGSERALLNAATMIGQSKNAFQSEIDAACELVDFLRFNCYFTSEIYREQPYYDADSINQLEYRPLEGFIFAVSPFNFTSIGGNLPTAPAITGNVALWKPASTAVYSNYFFMKLLMEAGLPDGVINFIPGPGSTVGPMVLNHPDLAGIHFTGSTRVLQSMYKTVAENIENYKSYPRIVGETGGKDFIFAHKSADVQELKTALVRGAFEYQGQKCSAASRAYIPSGLWNELKDDLLSTLENIKMGPPEDFTNFINAVIDEKAFDDIAEYIDYASDSEEAEIIAGGNYDKSKGFFIEPTVVLTSNPRLKLMEEEIFGPVLTIYVYPDDAFQTTLELCDNTSPYALTGAIFAKDTEAVVKAREMLRNAAGNFYINDKPTGAVVGKQPFGGARASGTNDKAGSKWNIMRWISPRTVKENLLPPTDYRYPFMEDK